MFNFKNVSFWLMIVSLSLISSIAFCLQLTTLPVMIGFFITMLVVLDVVDVINKKIRKDFIKSL